VNETNNSGMGVQEQKRKVGGASMHLKLFFQSPTMNLLAEGQLAQWAGIAAKPPHCLLAET
jgi:hypothetical protein